MEQQGQAPPRRSSGPAALLAILAIAGSAAAVLVYQLRQNREKPSGDLSGFDMAQAPEGPKQGASNAPAQAGQPQSSLGMIKSGMPGTQIGEKAAPPASAKKAEGSFAELWRRNEAQLRAQAMRYTRQYPIIRQYGKEWMSYPDLKKLNDDYWVDHDPAKFLRGAAASKNFGALVKKYATQAPFQAFVKEAVKGSPREVLSAGMDYVNQDNNAKNLINEVAKSMGLPMTLLGGAESEPKVDEKAVMDSIMKSNPDVQKAMSNPEVQKNLTPEAQKTLQNSPQ